jgi:hypothetical protein
MFSQGCPQSSTPWHRNSLLESTSSWSSHSPPLVGIDRAGGTTAQSCAGVDWRGFLEFSPAPCAALDARWPSALVIGGYLNPSSNDSRAKQKRASPDPEIPSGSSVLSPAVRIAPFVASVVASVCDVMAGDWQLTGLCLAIPSPACLHTANCWNFTQLSASSISKVVDRCRYTNHLCVVRCPALATVGGSRSRHIFYDSPFVPPAVGHARKLFLTTSALMLAGVPLRMRPQKHRCSFLQSRIANRLWPMLFVV